MADFSTWKRANLERLAAEATAELIRLKDANAALLTACEKALADHLEVMHDLAEPYPPEEPGHSPLRGSTVEMLRRAIETARSERKVG